MLLLAAEAEFRGDKGQLCEKSLQGVVHLRSDGRSMYLGTVHGRRPGVGQLAGVVWKWDCVAGRCQTHVVV